MRNARRSAMSYFPPESIMHQLLLCLFLTGIETDIDRKYNIMLGKYLHYVTCSCKTKCHRTCGCKRNGRSCSKDCKCDPTTCVNRKGRDSYDPDESAESTSTNVTSVENTDMMNTTVIIETSASEADADTPGLLDFKLPSKPHPRKVLAPVNGSTDASMPVKPKLKKENAFGGVSRKRSSDALKGDVAGIKGSLTNVENEGIVKRKRKLLGPSNRSFFKPLDV